MNKRMKKNSSKRKNKLTKKKDLTSRNINYRQYTKKIKRLYNFYKKVCEKRRPMNTKAIVIEHHPANPFTHISLTNDIKFINKYKDLLEQKPVKCYFKIKKFTLFKTKSKGPHLPKWFNENADYPLVWFTGIVDIIKLKNIDKSSNFEVDLLKRVISKPKSKTKSKSKFTLSMLNDLKYQNNKHHVTLSVLSMKRDADNYCNYRLGFEDFEDTTIIKEKSNNTRELNSLIKKMNAFQSKIFTGETVFTNNGRFLCYKIDITKDFQRIVDYSKDVLGIIFKELIEQ